MTFDQYGNLTPYEVIETDLQTFEKTFVTDFPTSTTRRAIFEAYGQYVADLRQIVGAGFYQWIDGSFTTQKLNPPDIDFISWIDLKIYELPNRKLNELRNLRFKKDALIDGYILPCYPAGHRKENINEINEKQWLFDWTRDDYKNPKGLIKLNF